MSDYVFNYGQYKNRINKKNNFNFLVIFLIIILLLGLCVFLKPRNNQLIEFNFVEIDCFQTYQQALNLSNEMNLEDNSVFIYFDGKYHLLASFYSQSEDAEKVANNLKSEYKNASVFTIETTGFVEQANLNKNQNTYISNFSSSSEETILSLENLSLLFDKKEITYNEIAISLKNIKDDFNDSYENLTAQFEVNSKYNLMKEYAYELQSIIDNISSLSEQDLSKSFRFQIVKFVVTHYQFLSCF